MIHYRGGGRGKGKGGDRRGWGATLYQSEMVLLIRWELFIWPRLKSIYLTGTE